MNRSYSKKSGAMQATRIIALIGLCAFALALASHLAEAVGTEVAYQNYLRQATVPEPEPWRGGGSDGDGVDDADDVCCQTPPGVPVDSTGRPLGDLDLDCDVDQADFAIFQRAYTGPLEPCSTEICDNGLDDDGDTFIDCDDWDCNDDPACVSEDCDNGLDDDDDGYTDCDDFDCIDHPACTGEDCDNGLDDDDDGFVDCDDWDCNGEPACPGEDCDNGLDDDDDGYADCDDFDCIDHPACG